MSPFEIAGGHTPPLQQEVQQGPILFLQTHKRIGTPRAMSYPSTAQSAPATRRSTPAASIVDTRRARARFEWDVLEKWQPRPQRSISPEIHEAKETAMPHSQCAATHSQR